MPDTKDPVDDIMPKEEASQEDAFDFPDADDFPDLDTARFDDPEAPPLSAESELDPSHGPERNFVDRVLKAHLAADKDRLPFFMTVVLPHHRDALVAKIHAIKSNPPGGLSDAADFEAREILARFIEARREQAATIIEQSRARVRALEDRDATFRSKVAEMRRRLMRLGPDVPALAPTGGLMIAMIMQPETMPAVRDKIMTWDFDSVTCMDGGRLSFTPNNVRVDKISRDAVALLVAEAKSRGWTKLEASGPPAFRELLMMQCKQEGLEVHFQPTFFRIPYRSKMHLPGPRELADVVPGPVDPAPSPVDDTDRGPPGPGGGAKQKPLPRSIPRSEDTDNDSLDFLQAEVVRLQEMLNEQDKDKLSGVEKIQEDLTKARERLQAAEQKRREEDALNSDWPPQPRPN